MKNILTVGGAGYIGGLTTDILTEKGYNVTVYDNLMFEERFLKDCSFIYGDIRDTDKLVDLEKEYDEIIWLAAIVGDGACAQDTELTQEVNVNSLRRFLKKTRRKVIFASTCSVYGAQKEVLDENSPTHPLSLYASTKLEAEKYVLGHGGTVFRLGTLYGLGDRHSRIRLDLVINILTLKAIRENKLTVFGGEQWRPIIAVRDVAEYIAEAVTRHYNDIFIVKYKNVTIMEIANILKKVFPQVKIEITDMKFEDLRNYHVNSERAEKHFTFQPQATIENEAKRMRRLLEERRIKDVDDDVYYNTKYVKVLLNKKK